MAKLTPKLAMKLASEIDKILCPHKLNVLDLYHMFEWKALEILLPSGCERQKEALKFIKEHHELSLLKAKTVFAEYKKRKHLGGIRK